jgi:hypothetical protein
MRGLIPVALYKSSSLELSEAINSMFSWYEMSRVCYVYLEDVGGDWEDELSRSRWFRKGWTLQELLAPVAVRFYTSKWDHIGDKSTLGQKISDITRIDIDSLNSSGSMFDRSIACRMSWAADRHTTREEDQAYCLMEIFQVNMPLLYGEGSNAFSRLQEEILKISDDQTIFAFDFALNGATTSFIRDKAPGCGNIPFMSEEMGWRTGALANSPENFKNSLSIIPVRTGNQIITTTITNIGLQITMPIVPIKIMDAWENTEPLVAYIGLIPCTDYEKHHYLLGILLVKLERNNVFERISLRRGMNLFATILVPLEIALLSERKPIFIQWVRRARTTFKPFSHVPDDAIHIRVGQMAGEGLRVSHVIGGDFVWVDFEQNSFYHLNNFEEMSGEWDRENRIYKLPSDRSRRFPKIVLITLEKNSRRHGDIDIPPLQRQLWLMIPCPRKSTVSAGIQIRQVVNLEEPRHGVQAGERLESSQFGKSVELKEFTSSKHLNAVLEDVVEIFNQRVFVLSFTQDSRR